MPIRPLTHAQRMKAQRQPEPEDRPSAAKRGYGHTWRKLRRMKLNLDPMCQEPGCDQPATDVDHIKPLTRGGDNSMTNLASLCHMHHSRKTAKYDGAFGRKVEGEDDEAES